MVISKKEMMKRPALKILLVSLVLGIFLFVVKDSVVAGYGEAASAPVCTAEKPSKAWLYLAQSVAPGTVDLFWDKVDRAGSWTVAYGVESGKYIYGVSNFGDYNSRNLRISLLPAGVYYFVVRANNDCMPGEFSNEWRVQVGRGVAPRGTVTYTPRGTPAPEEEGVVTPTPRAFYVPPTEVRAHEELTPTPTPRVSPFQPRGQISTPTPTPTPRPGLFQRIFNLLFGWITR